MKKKHAASYLLLAITCPAFVMADQAESENKAVIDEISYVVRSDGWGTHVVNYYSQGVPQNKYKMMFLTEKQERTIPKFALQISLLDSSGNQIIGKEVKGGSKCSGVGYGIFFQCYTTATFDNKNLNNYQDFVVNELDAKEQIIGTPMVAGKLPELNFSLEASQSGGAKDTLVVTSRKSNEQLEVGDITIKEREGEKNYITIDNNQHKNFTNGVYKVPLNLASCPQDVGVFSWSNTINAVFVINGKEVPYSVALRGGCDPLRLKIKQAEIERQTKEADLKRSKEVLSDAESKRTKAEQDKKMAEEKLANAKKDYEDVQTELQKALDALLAIDKADESEKLLNEAKVKISQKEKSRLDKTVGELQAELRKANDASTRLQNDIASYQEARRIYQEAAAKKEEADKLGQGLPDAESRVNAAETALNNKKEELNTKQKELDVILNNIESLRDTISAGTVEAQKTLAKAAVDACNSYLGALRKAAEDQAYQLHFDENDLSAR